MTVYEQLIEVCSHAGDRLLSAYEIKVTLQTRYGTNPASVIPSDYCYNRRNKTLGDRNHLFVRVGASEYRYLGPGFAYTGLIYSRPKGATHDRVVGEWVEGKRTLYANAAEMEVESSESVDSAKRLPTTAANRHPMVEVALSEAGPIPMSAAQLDRLYETYMGILELEVAEFGCKPTETRHLIGRLGELYCARLCQGQLAREVNEQGFDVVSGTGRRISVKTTAQRSGFVSINAKTASRADDLMILRYAEGALEVMYHGEMAHALSRARLLENRYELDVSKARRLVGHVKTAPVLA